MEYKVIWAENLTKLTEEVQNDLDDGWEPQGGIYVLLKNNGYPSYYQAMIRK